MFYKRFLEAVNRWPDKIALEIQRQPGATPSQIGTSNIITTADGHVVEQYSYRQAQSNAEKIGAWLVKRGLPRGSRCAILASNSPRWVATQVGIIAAGHTAVPLDTAFTATQAGKLLDDSGACILFTDARSMEVSREAVKRRKAPVQLVLMDAPSDELPNFEKILSAESKPFTAVETAPDDVLCLLYTSGTTSDPKGVMLTDTNFLGEMDAVFQFLKIGPTDALLGVLPLFHALAQMANIMLPLVFGMKVVFLDALNTTELMIGLRERDITIFCCVPQFFYLIQERIFGELAKKGRPVEFVFRILMGVTRLLRHVGINPGRLFFGKVHKTLGPKMRFFVTGGSRFDPLIGEDFHALGFTILQAYGLTEVTGGAFCTPMNDIVNGSIGIPLPATEAKLINVKPDEDGHMVGEIAIRGPLVMKGYYNRPDVTAAAMQDGWFLSGDLAYQNRKGHYFIAGRAKDLIVLSSGKNIYPEEIESYYLRSPFIKEICVLGLVSNKPGEPHSERLHGVIVPNFETMRQRKVVNAREVIRFDVETISAAVPPTKRILSYDIWQEDLPRTTTRKIRRNEVEKRVKAAQARGEGGGAMMERPLSAEEQQWMAIPEVKKALGVILKAAKGRVGKVHPADNLELDLGLDSMARVELLVALENSLSAEMDDNAASEVYTVREVVDLVRKSAGTAGRQGQGWDAVLAQDLDDKEIIDIIEKHGLLTNFLWWAFGRSVQLTARIFFRLEVHGMEKMPKGPFILSPNHASYLDPPVLVGCLPTHVFKRAFFIGTSEIFGEGAMRKFAAGIHLVPVDPDANLVPGMRAGAYGLRKGMVFVIYPEGERSIDGSPKIFKKGAAILSRTLNMPIVPLAQQGFFEALPRGHGFQGFHKFKIQVGEPMWPDMNEPPEQAYDRITADLKARVTQMWQELGGVDERKRKKLAAKAAGGD